MGQQSQRQRQLAYIQRGYMNKVWRQRALVNDILLGTRLGTLGYLPFEIRWKIWRYLLVFSVQSNLPVGGFWQGQTLGRPFQHQLRADNSFDTQMFWVHPEHRDAIFDQIETEDVFDIRTYYVHFHPWKSKLSGEVYFAGDTLYNLRNTSPSIKFEIDKAFLSTQNLSFDNPQMLATFFTILPEEHHNSCHNINIWLGMRPRWYNHQWLYCHMMNGDIEAWTNAISYIPSGIRSVTIRVGGIFRMREQELRVLYMMAKTAKEVTPDVVIMVSEEGIGGSLSRETKAAFDAAVKDATEPRGSDKSNQDAILDGEKLRPKGMQSKRYPHEPRLRELTVRNKDFSRTTQKH